MFESFVGSLFRLLRLIKIHLYAVIRLQSRSRRHYSFDFGATIRGLALFNGLRDVHLLNELVLQV